MDRATWCRTPAAASAVRRLRPEVSKKSSTALPSNEGELARSTTTCVPARACARPSPVMVFTPVLGAAATTSWPPWRRMAAVFEPIRPVPPIMRIFISRLQETMVPLARLASSAARWAATQGLGASGLDERQDVGVHDFGMGRAHPMRELRIDFEGAVLEQLR